MVSVSGGLYERTDLTLKYSHCYIAQEKRAEALFLDDSNAVSYYII